MGSVGVGLRASTRPPGVPEDSCPGWGRGLGPGQHSGEKLPCPCSCTRPLRDLGTHTALAVWPPSGEEGLAPCGGGEAGPELGPAPLLMRQCAAPGSP